jgi:hypothetical protein
MTNRAMDYESGFDSTLSEAAHPATAGETLTVPQAHRAVRQHRSCNRDPCSLKALAVQVLCDARHMRHADTYDRAKR